MIPDIWTYKDVIDHALDYMGAATDEQSERFARRSIQAAHVEMQNQKNWGYFYSVGQILTVAPYSTGTVTYDHTGGAYNRLMTLTTGVWPTWAADGIVIISEVTYHVVQRVSDTLIVLSDSLNPGADITTATAYSIVRHTYPMPTDCGSVGEVVIEGRQVQLSNIPPSEIVSLQSSNFSPSQPQFYAFVGDPNRFEAMSLRLHPAPDAIYSIKMSYRRRPRQLRIDKYDTGTVTTTNGSTAISGIGTTWTSSLVGSIIRFSADTVNIPTGIAGASPFWKERSIASFSSATSMVLDADPQQTLTGVKHCISDPVDIETGSMLTYYLREIERQCRIIRRMKPVQGEEDHYTQAKMSALEADNRHHGRRAVFDSGNFGRNFSDMPSGAEI